MLGVENAELAAGIRHDLAYARRKKFKRHMAECDAAFAQLGANRIAPHRSPRFAGGSRTRQVESTDLALRWAASQLHRAAHSAASDVPATVAAIRQSVR